MGSSETGVGYISFSYKMINVMVQMIEIETYSAKEQRRKDFQYETATKSG